MNKNSDTENEEIITTKETFEEFVDKLLSQSFEGWTEEAAQGYFTACETLREWYKINNNV